MKTLKKNNKGFSLVELIVVILIMAIIAVALAPQVMKWVDESKVSADNNNETTLKSAIDAAVADYMHEVGSLTSGVEYHISEKLTIKDETGAALADGLETNLAAYITKTLNSQYPEVQQDTDGYFRVVITQEGAVTVTTCNPSGTPIPTPTTTP